MNPDDIGNARGEKAVANFDEDSITMAVAAGIDALKGFERSNWEDGKVSGHFKEVIYGEVGEYEKTEYDEPMFEAAYRACEKLILRK